MNQVTETLKKIETKVKITTKNILKLALIAIGAQIVKTEWVPTKLRYVAGIAVLAVMISSCSSRLTSVTANFESNTATPIARTSDLPPIAITLTALATPENTPTIQLIIADTATPENYQTPQQYSPIQLTLTALDSGNATQVTSQNTPVFATATPVFSQPNTPEQPTLTPNNSATPTNTAIEAPTSTPSPKETEVKTSYTLTIFGDNNSQIDHQVVLPNAKCGLGVILAPGIYDVRESDLKFHKQLFEQRIGYNAIEDSEFIANMDKLNSGKYTINGYVTAGSKVFLVNFQDKWLLINGNLPSIQDLSTLTNSTGYIPICVGINQGFGARLIFFEKVDTKPQLLLIEN